MDAPWLAPSASNVANLGTIVATIVGLGVVYATRRQARLSFLVTILVVIYCSPVVMVGNFALLLAAVSPWAMPDRSGQSAQRGPGPARASGRGSIRAA